MSKWKKCSTAFADLAVQVEELDKGELPSTDEDALALKEQTDDIRKSIETMQPEIEKFYKKAQIDDEDKAVYGPKMREKIKGVCI